MRKIFISFISLAFIAVAFSGCCILTGGHGQMVDDRELVPLQIKDDKNKPKIEDEKSENQLETSTVFE